MQPRIQKKSRLPAGESQTILDQTLTTRDCKGPQTNMPKNVGSIKTWSAKMNSRHIKFCNQNLYFCWSCLHTYYVLRHIRFAVLCSPLWLMLMFVLYVFWGRRSFIDSICRNSCMVLSMCLRLVLANYLFSLRDINLTLGLLPPRRHVVWRDSVGVEACRSELKSECADILHQSFLVVTPYWRAPTRAKQLSMATIPLCFEFFRCRVDVLQS